MTEAATPKSTWPLIHFGDVVQNVNVTVNPEESGLKLYVAGEHMQTDDLHIRSWGTIGDGYLGPAFHRKFVKGQVLYGSRRTYLRKVAVAEFDGICANTTFVLEAKNGLLPELLPFIMQTEAFTQHSIGRSKGSVNPYVNWKDIACYEFPLPPLDEQHRIADLLWAADEVVQRCALAIADLKTLQRVNFETWLRERGVEEQWPEVMLDEVCTIQNGQVDPTVLPYCNLIHIASDDIESETGNILEKNTAAEDRITSGNYGFTEEAILYSKIRPNLKKVAFPHFPGVCSADVYPVYAQSDILPDFLFHILLSGGFTTYAIAHSVRSAIPKINRDAMLKYRFKLPPLEQQKAILAVLGRFSVSTEELSRHIWHSKKLNRLLGETLLFSR